MNFILRWYPSPTNPSFGLWGLDALNLAACDVMDKLLASDEWKFWRFEGEDDNHVSPADQEYNDCSSDSVLLLLSRAGITKDEVLVEAPVWKMCEPEVFQSLRKDQTWRVLLYEADAHWQDLLRKRQERKENALAHALKWVSDVMPVVERLEREKKRPN
jgi:hypothetical protein